MTSSGAQLVPVLGNHVYMSNEQSAILTEVGRERTWYVDQVGIVRIRAGHRAGRQSRADHLATGNARFTDRYCLDHRRDAQAGLLRRLSRLGRGDRATVGAAVRAVRRPARSRRTRPRYQRSRPIDGVTYVVSGGAATLRPTGHEDFTAVSTSTLHYVDLLAEDDPLTLRAINQSGMLFDPRADPMTPPASTDWPVLRRPSGFLSLLTAAPRQSEVTRSQPAATHRGDTA